MVNVLPSLLDCFTDEGREQYNNIPAIIVRDDLPFDVREYDVDLGLLPWDLDLEAMV